MKKRKATALILTALAAGTLAGCGNTESETIGGADGPTSIIVTNDTKDMQNTQSTDVVNVTDTVNTEITIDYSITSHAPVTNFGFQLFNKQAADADTTNPVLSPVSAYIALTMAGDGADGTTLEEFQNVLGEDMQVLSDDMMNRLPSENDSMTLALANSAWLDDEFTADEEWLGTMKSLYDAQAYSANLSMSDALNAMNQWVSDNTNGLIENMLDQPLDEETRLVLFNTLYFNAKWQMQFTPESTYEQIFWLDDGTQTDAEMMHEYGCYQTYVSNDSADGVLLSYQDSSLAFLALRPHGNQGSQDNMTVRELAASLDAETIADLLANQQEDVYMDIVLPKFEVSYDAVLNETLQDIGLTTAFDEENANLTKLGTTEQGGNLYISLVRQKAVVRVDEAGTEAAAATEVVMAEAAALIEDLPLDMTFDHPFLYMILDTDTQIPLFIGIMDNPNA